MLIDAVVRGLFGSWGMMFFAAGVIWLKYKFVQGLEWSLIKAQGTNRSIWVRQARARTMIGMMKWAVLGVVAHYVWILPFLIADGIHLIPASWGMPAHIVY